MLFIPSLAFSARMHMYLLASNGGGSGCYFWYDSQHINLFRTKLRRHKV